MKDAPNILFLCTDQQRWDCIGIHNPHIKTPNLDALAKRGILFDQAVCNNPICVPSRYSFSTGLYSHQVGVRNNNQAIQRDADMPIQTIFERLQDAGYLTIGCGKTHWNMMKRPDFPDRDIQDKDHGTRGFEFRYIARRPNGYDHEPNAIYYYDEARENLEWMVDYEHQVGPYSGGCSFEGYMGCTSPYNGDGMREHWLTTKGLEMLETLKHRDQPWHLFLSFDFPHAPLPVPKDYEDLYSLDDIPDINVPPEKPLDRHYDMYLSDDITEKWLALQPRERKEIWRRYYAVCSYVDAQFGRIFDYLKESGQEENTFIVFTSDHGESLGERHRFQQCSLYEPSVRVPLIVAGAGVPKEKHGTIDSRYAELIDITPTICVAAGLDHPQELPGENLLEPSLRRGGFSEWHSTGFEDIHYAPAYMWRTKEWKLILYYTEGEADQTRNNIINARRNSHNLKGELYHLPSDPQEYNNLYQDPDYFEQREAMTRELFYNFALNTCYFPRFSSFANTRPRPGIDEPKM